MVAATVWLMEGMVLDQLWPLVGDLVLATSILVEGEVLQTGRKRGRQRHTKERKEILRLLLQVKMAVGSAVEGEGVRLCFRLRGVFGFRPGEMGGAASLGATKGVAALQAGVEEGFGQPDEGKKGLQPEEKVGGGKTWEEEECRQLKFVVDGVCSVTAMEEEGLP